ncbi:MAG: site-specific integrase [bacterium]
MKIPKIYLYQRGEDGIWYVRYSWRGKRWHYSLRTTDETEAEREKKKIIFVIEEKIHRPKQRVIFENLWERYKKEEWPEKQPSTRMRDETSIKFLRVFFGGTRIDESTFREKVRRYRTARLNGGLYIKGVSKKKKVSAYSVNQEIALLKRIVNLAVYEWQLLDRNPLEKFPMLKVKKRKRPIPPDEWQRLIAAANPELRDFLMVARFTGIRSGEKAHGILGLTWSDIDLENSEIRIPDSKIGEGRTVYINETLYNILVRRKQKATSKYIFPGEDGQRRSSFKTAFQAAKRRAGITNLRIHDLRHLFGTDAKSEGWDLPSIAKIMGHRDITTTMRYGEPNEEHLRRLMKSRPKKPPEESGPKVDQN